MSCVCSSGATMLPQYYTTGATDISPTLGPLFPGQSLTCSKGDALCTPLASLQMLVSSLTPLVLDSLGCTCCLAQPGVKCAVPVHARGNRLVCKQCLSEDLAGDIAGGGILGSCTVTFNQLALASSIACGPYMSFSCPSCNSTAAVLQSTPDADHFPHQPYCNGTLHLVTPTGSFTDGSPAGADYAPSSFCQWLIDPGYRFGSCVQNVLCYSSLRQATRWCWQCVRQLHPRRLRPGCLSLACIA